MPANRFDIEKIRSALAGAKLILTPNHRISTAILDSYSASVTGTTWKTPTVIAIDIWIKKQWQQLANRGVSPCCDSQLLEDTEELLIWSAVIEQSLHKHPLLNPDETAALASRTYQDLRQCSLDETTHKLNNFLAIPDVAVYAHWQEKFQQQCREHKLITLVDATRNLNQLVESGKVELPQQLILVNFYQPPKLYQALFKTLQQQTDLAVYHGDKYKNPKQLVRYEFPDAQSEINACARWIEKTIQQHPDCHIGIISNQDSGARLELERRYLDLHNPQSLINLSEDPAVFNDSAANQKLIDAGFIGDALLVLNLNTEPQNSDELCRLLQSPFLLGHEEEIEARLQMEMFMRRYMHTFCSGTELSRLMSTESRPYHSPMLANAMLKSRTEFRAMKDMNTAREWAGLFQRQLSLFGWPGKNLTAQENAQLLQWQHVLERFAEASRVLGKLRFSTALAKLRMLCLNTSEGKFSQSANQVSICSPSEATGLNFSHIYLLACDDQSWPGPARPSPFLPHVLQRELSIPHSNSELQYQLCCEQFQILCDSTSESIVASHYCNDDDQARRASSLVLDFPLQAVNESTAIAVNNYAATILAADSRPGHFLHSISDKQRVALKEAEIPRGGTEIISNQSSCPFKAFATHRLHAEPLQEFSNGLNSMARGSAIHRALETLFATIQSSQQLRSLTEPEKQQLIRQASSQAIKFLSSRHPEVMTPRFREIEQQRIQNLLQGFLDKEAARPDFSVIAREQKQHWQLAASDEAAGLALNLQIDRIDQLEDGSFAVIDYKSGKRSYSSRDWLQERAEDMQLPVYYCASSSGDDKDISAIAIAHVNVEKLDYSGISRGECFHKSIKPFNKDGKLDTDWAQLTQHWQQQVHSLAADFAAGQARVDPIDVKKSCQYCALNSLCRIRELSAAVDYSDDGEDFEGAAQ